MDFSGPYLPHSPVKGVLGFSDLSRTIYKWFDGMIYGLAENKSQSGGLWWLEALASGEAAGAVPVQSTEDPGKALPPCADGYRAPWQHGRAWRALAPAASAS